MKQRRFTRLEGVLLLSLIIAVCCCLLPYINRITGTDSDGFTARQERKQAYNNRKTKKTRSDDYFYTPSEKKQLFDFDPNTADSTQLLQLGLTRWQVKNIYKYRAKGGRYRKPEDFAKLYGLTLELFEQLKPHIKIKPERMAAEVYGNTNTPHPAAHTNQYYQPKLREGEHIDVNKADTTQLKMIPGIGSYYASKIVKQRQRLGGFATISQIGQIEGIPPSSLPYMTLGDTPQLTKLHINTMSEKELAAHPYLRYTQAKDIVRVRRIKGTYKTIDDLRRVPTLTPEDITNLSPYIEF